MNGLMDTLFSGDVGGSVVGPETVLLAMLVAFCLGHIIAWVYMGTHTGLSYSQMFTMALLVLPVLVALIMLLMAGSFIMALGLFAIIAIVRFRNVLKDTRDTTFVLWSIIAGMSCGTLRFTTGVLGCLFVALVFLYMRFTSFGGRHRYDVIISLLWTGGLDRLEELKRVLQRHSAKAQLASQRDIDQTSLDLSYRLQLRDPTRSRELIEELQAMPGAERVSLYHREDESEI